MTQDRQLGISADLAAHIRKGDPHYQYVATADVDDTPVNGATTVPVSSNWAFDHVAAADPHTVYILHSLATAINDFLVASGAGAFVKKTLAETLTILGKAAASGLASLDGSSKVVQDPANATATPTAGKIPIADGSGKLDGWITTNKITLGAPGTLTIAAGVITATLSYHTIDTESAAATDDLDTINGGADGQLIILRPANDTHTIVLKNGTGNIVCGTDATLDSYNDTWQGIYDATLAKWLEIGRSDNAP